MYHEQLDASFFWPASLGSPSSVSVCLILGSFHELSPTATRPAPHVHCLLRILLERSRRYFSVILSSASAVT